MRFNPYFSIAKRLLRLRRKPIRAKRLGAQWELYPNDWIDNRLLIGRPFEREQLAFAKTCIEKYGLTTFYDCGANIGLYSVVLGTNLPSLHIHSFEPVKTTHERLSKNLMLNALEASAHNYGLGDKLETRTIVYDKNSSGTASLDTKVQNHPKRNFQTKYDIEIRTFDSQFKKTRQNAFLKLDIEGHEAAALLGMEKFLGNNECVMQIELWKEHKNQVKEWLETRGYFVFHNIGHDLYFKQKT